MAFSPDGSKLAVAYANGTVILWDPTDGRAERVLEGPLQFVSSVAFSPDGRTLAAGTGYWTRREIDGLIDLWDVVTGKPGPLWRAQGAGLLRCIRPRWTGGRIGWYRRNPPNLERGKRTAAPPAVEAGRLDLRDRLRP